MDGIESLEDLRALAYAFRRSRVLLTAYELGVFTVLGGGPRTPDDVAAVLGTDPRATDRLLNACVAIGLLQKEDVRFKNGEAADRFLVKGRAGYLSGLMHTVHTWENWSTLTEAVKKGTSVRPGPVSGREEVLRAFIEAMEERGGRQVEEVVEAVDLTGVERLLDVGGGSGIFARAFCRASDTLTATVFDLPEVIGLTREYIAADGLSDRVDTRAGDYLKDDLGGGYDLAFLSAILHSNSPKENRLLMGKCAGALRPGGRVIVQDFIMSPNRSEPAHGALFALNMLVATEAGDSYTEEEIRGWMESAGLLWEGRSSTRMGADQVTGRLPS